MKYRDLVEEYRRKLYVDNYEELLGTLNTKAVEKKIQSFVFDRVPFATVEEVKAKIKTDKMFAMFFAKDPLRQNIGEIVLKEYLKVSFLPKGGSSALRFTEQGELTHIKIPTSTKSVDFKIGNWYFTQKYTGKNTGGAQDNQYADVVHFLSCGSKKHKVAACVDGWYWEENGKRKQLQNIFSDNPNVKVCSADDIKNGVIIFD